MNAPAGLVAGGAGARLSAGALSAARAPGSGVAMYRSWYTRPAWPCKARLGECLVGKRRLGGSLAILLVGVALAAACSASGSNSASGGSGGAAVGGAGGSDSGISVPDAADDHKLTPDGACAQQTYAGEHVPAAVLIVLDRSSSMSTNGKWAAAQLAIAQAIDLDSFDNQALGLLAYPASVVPGPACLFGIQVSCGISALPQVQLANAGTDKSNASSGVRHQIYNWLTSNFPDNTATDASPGYDAMNGAIQALQAYKFNGRRVLVFITDGGFSCTSLSSRGGYSDGQCNDWEWPSNVIQLLRQAQLATKPVDTFIVGVPGSDSTGQPQGPYATAPYNMRRALSAYAMAGSPKTVPQGCDGTFSKTGGDPAIPCHFDMTTGTFDAQALADVVDKIRGQALTCFFAVPQPESGTVDTSQLNVDITANGQSRQVPNLPLKSTKTCPADGCWHYTDNSNTQIELLGKACDDVKNATTSKVQILVGCEKTATIQ